MCRGYIAPHSMQSGGYNIEYACNSMQNGESIIEYACFMVQSGGNDGVTVAQVARVTGEKILRIKTPNFSASNMQYL